NKALFDTGMKIGKSVRQFLPGALQKKVPQAKSMKKPVIGSHTRKVFILDGCVQPGMMPTIDEATMLVLDRLGVQAVVAPKSGCCGAVKFHLNDHDGARTQMRANIDAWWPQIEKGEVEALVMNASGCGVTVREYGFYLENDPAYADKAKKISELTVDIGEFLAREADLSALTSIVADGIQANRVPAKIAYHPPCTLQHGQQVKGVVEKVLTDCGFELVPVQDSHLCCGSAGTYSVLQPKLANELKKRKLANLMSNGPQAIASSNIGCLAHLESDAQVEVRHWIEWVARAID
ncbi:MAG: glycolate oxidase subunit GlcF, partial [Limnobacter sp.]|nr:glycolate oxidase subunit GlcF [Limnobacter sp.]